MNMIEMGAAFIVGCIMGLFVAVLLLSNNTQCDNCINDLNTCNNELTEYKISLNISSKNYNTCVSERDTVGRLLQHCNFELDNCTNTPCNCSTAINVTKYNFGCDDVQVTPELKNEYTKYQCFWELKNRDYPNGRYYTPCTVCALKIGKWREHCECAKLMSDICTSPFAQVNESFDISYWTTR